MKKQVKRVYFKQGKERPALIRYCHVGVLKTMKTCSIRRPDPEYMSCFSKSPSGLYCIMHKETFLLSG